MAKDSILDRADRLRRDKSSEAKTGTKTGVTRGAVRRRGAKRDASPATPDNGATATAAPIAPAAARTVRRRARPAPAPEPTPVPVAQEAPAPVPVAPVVAREPAPVVVPEPVAPEPVVEPVAVEPVVEPVVVEPEPVVVEPEPVAVEPEPVVVEPVATEPEPEPVVVEPEPVVVEPVVVEPVAAEPEPVVAEPVDAEPEPAAATAEAAEPAPNLDDLLAAPRKKRVHKVLSDEEIEAEASGQKGEITVVKAIEPEAAAAAEPVAAEPVAAEPAKPAEPAKAEPASLEDLLKEQGIVQHKPKKGRRIIEDSMTAGMAAPPKVEPPKPKGVSLYASNEPKNKPIRFLDPAQIQREREARDRRAGKGKRKTVRRDGLYSASERRRRKGRGGPRSSRATELTTPAAHKRVIKMHGGITVADLADGVGIKGGQMVKILVGMGNMVSLNERLDVETAQLIANEFEYEVEDISFKEETIIDQATEVEEDPDLEPRPPVVTIMGHVDHGKTSILDAIRSAKVAEGEAGGITQHVSAFDVTAGGNRITFVDTPGHAAFTAMRARGAQMTDIVVLVVAASEGVMPQTMEVISHAKAAQVPIIVAMNKMDLKEANPDRAKQQLSEHELIPEDWGGDIQIIPMSAKKREGIDELLEAINLQAEMLELTANPKRIAAGRVVEAQFEKGRGAVAVALVQHGTLKAGDIIVAGQHYGRVKAMFETGARKPKKLKKAGPSSPVSIIGLSGLPDAGDEFNVVKTDKDAKAVIEHRREIAKAELDKGRAGVNLEDLYRRMQEGETKELNLIIKADVQGSIEALKKVFDEIEVRETRIKILHSAVGGVTEGDVTLAEASEAVIVGFGVRPDAKARRLAEARKVDVRTYRVIYEAVDEIRNALVGMLDPEYKERVQGHAEVRNLFKISKIGTIAGCAVQDGKIGRNHNVRVLRNSVVTWEGRLKSLRRFKDDVREVLQGYECGIGLDGFDDLKDGDILESFIVEEIRPTA
jgi:translation initiation factor IF-2